MAEKHTVSAVDYHWDHTHVRHRLPPHSLDFAHYPLPFKPYPGARASAQASPDTGDVFPDPAGGGLSDLLYFACGVTHVRRAGGMPFFLRTVPSAGGLYPCHLYLGIAPGEDEPVKGTKTGPDTAETGVYYYNPVGGDLVQLRAGKHVGSGHAKEISPETHRLFFMVTGGFYNSAWKYRGRAYRYLLLDAGHLVRNLELVLCERGLAHDVTYDFHDPGIAGLLGLDMDNEVPLACVAVSWDRSVSDITAYLSGATRPCAPGPKSRPAEIRYMANHTILPHIHALGIRGRQPGRPLETVITDAQPLDTADISPADAAGHGLAKLLIRRRSRRNFVPDAVDSASYRALFAWLRSGVQNDRDFNSRCLQVGMVCQNLQALTDGFYLFDNAFSRAHLMDQCRLADVLASVCLDQAWIGRAAITFLFFADLDALETAYGPRGYRHMMITAGRLAQDIYLGAESLGFGCCGIGALYDREAVQCFDLAGNAALVYAVSAGPVKKRIGG
ncbi:MAG: SagB family peptide dehydrogenase [Desulfobacter sp.]